MKKLLVLTLSVLAVGALSASADVAANWEKNCQKCHGADGKGDTKMGKKTGAKDMTAAEYQTNLKDDAAFKAIKEGIKDGDTVKMKPAEDLSDADIKELVGHVRKFKK
jgi:cytochrome c553